MTTQQNDSNPSLRIQTPCPKRWDELEGGEGRRFCSQCSLHVVDGAALTRVEATTLVANATQRVCMRLEVDATGTALYKDSARPARRSFTHRAAQWAASMAALVLAACSRGAIATTPCDPTATPSTTTGTSLMGKVRSTELMGDVAVPPPPVTGMRLGEVSVEPPSKPEVPPTPVTTPGPH